MKGLPNDLTFVPAYSLAVIFVEDVILSYQHGYAHIEMQRKISQDQTNHV
jgi:hypothetical protein